MVDKKPGITIKEWDPVENTVKRDANGEIIAQEYIVPVLYRSGDKTEIKIKSTLISLGDLNEWATIVQEETSDKSDPLSVVRATLRFLKKFVVSPDLSSLDPVQITGKTCDELESVLSFLMKESGYSMGDDTKNSINSPESSVKSKLSNSFMNADTSSLETAASQV
jgi:hypothetical protein